MVTDNRGDVVAGWSACKGEPPTNPDRDLTVNRDGSVVITNRAGQTVTVAHGDIPRLAVKLAAAWKAGLSDGDAVPWSDVRMETAADAAVAWYPA